MSEDQKILQFNAKIDQMLGVEQSGRIPNSDSPSESLAALQLASQLIDFDLHSETWPNPAMRARWMSQCRLIAENPSKQKRQSFPNRWVWAAVIGLVLISTFLIFRQPVLAAVGRLLGYGYFPQSGFVLLDTARVLRAPVQQEHEGKSLTVMAGLSTPEKTTLWLKFSTDPIPPDGSWLETSTGEKLKLTLWEWEQAPSSRLELHIEFPPLPESSTQMTLVLPEGWRLPLEWIPASHAYALPLGNLASLTPTLTAGTPVPTLQLAIPCIQDDGLQVCLKAAANDPQGTHLLLEATSLDQQLTPGSEQGLIAPTSPVGDVALSLKDQQGNVLPSLGQSFEPVQDHPGVGLQSITFPLISAQAQTLTLQIPGFQAYQRLTAPLTLRVDLGADPRPGQTLTIDQEITVLGQAIRFHQAILEGDGVTSLRLILTSDPIQAQGLQFRRFELGKLDGMDDRYGSDQVGQDKISVHAELIGVVSGEKTGIVTLPVTGVQFTRFGPFEFTFPAPALVSWLPTPAPVMDRDNFIPQPLPTPMP